MQATHSETAGVNYLIAGRYPRDVVLADGSRLTMLPLAAIDCRALLHYLADVPETEQLFLRQDLSVMAEQWCSELDYRHTLPILVWHGARIAADGTLHRDPGIWTSHIGKLRLFVHPDYRRRGVGTALVRELVDVGHEYGLAKLVVECAREQEQLIELLQRFGFVAAARLPDFIRDRHRRLHEMVLMVYDLN